MGVMTTVTISTYYCTFCGAVKKAALTALMGMIAFGESTGRARAASALAQQGYPELARKIMLGDDK
jgi:hypothetical protein|tara:strand:- start:215 stop:412 length:198 start_codon:yes stop_codon:yes gene_type:complete